MIVLPYYETVPVYLGVRNYQPYDLFCLFTHLQPWLSEQNPAWIIRVGTWPSPECNHLTIELGPVSDQDEALVQNKVNQLTSSLRGYCYLLKAHDWWEASVIPRLVWTEDNTLTWSYDETSQVLMVKHTSGQPSGMLEERLSALAGTAALRVPTALDGIQRSYKA